MMERRDGKDGRITYGVLRVCRRLRILCRYNTPNLGSRLLFPLVVVVIVVCVPGQGWTEVDPIAVETKRG